MPFSPSPSCQAAHRGLGLEQMRASPTAALGCLAMATCLAGCSGSAGGDPLPAIENIRSLRANYFDLDSGQEREFDVPSGHWRPILAALQPARWDSDPAK